MQSKLEAKWRLHQDFTLFEILDLTPSHSMTLELWTGCGFLCHLMFTTAYSSQPTGQHCTIWLCPDAERKRKSVTVNGRVCFRSYYRQSMGKTFAYAEPRRTQGEVDVQWSLSSSACASQKCDSHQLRYPPTHLLSPAPAPKLTILESERHGMDTTPQRPTSSPPQRILSRANSTWSSARMRVQRRCTATLDDVEGDGWSDAWERWYVGSGFRTRYRSSLALTLFSVLPVCFSWTLL